MPPTLSEVFFNTSSVPTNYLAPILLLLGKAIWWWREWINIYYHHARYLAYISCLTFIAIPYCSPCIIICCGMWDLLSFRNWGSGKGDLRASPQPVWSAARICVLPSLITSSLSGGPEGCTVGQGDASPSESGEPEKVSVSAKYTASPDRQGIRAPGVGGKAKVKLNHHPQSARRSSGRRIYSCCKVISKT